MDVDVDALRWFQQVADGVTVTEVSEVERVTQSGVSRALARLEAEVGTPLLHRSGRTLRMTRAGTAFKRHLDAMLHELDDGLAAVSELVDPETGTVAVAVQLSLGTWLLPDLVASFRAEHPDVQFVLRQVRDELVTSALDGGGVDLEITTLRPSSSSVHWRSLLVEPLRLAVSSEHRLASYERVGLHEVSDEPFIGLRPTSLLRKLCEQLCQQAGFTPHITFETEDLPTLQGFVAAGLGVAIVPAPHGVPIAPSPRLRYLEIIDKGATREIGVSWSSQRPLLPSANLFRRHVIARARARALPALAEPA
jgi:DNA-binding transcriptional LysR family regulator